MSASATERMFCRHDSTWQRLQKLYATPLPSTRTGALYNAFSYPTKISPEAIGLFIACHTRPGEVVLDTFAGSGTTGLGTLLCDKPTPEMIQMAKNLGVAPVWGARKAILYELSTLGAFVSETMCIPPDPDEFADAAEDLLAKTEESHGRFYETKDEIGRKGRIRHVIWTDFIVCPHCETESKFWDVAVKRNPLKLVTDYRCPGCRKKVVISEAERATEEVYDAIIKSTVTRRKRVPAWVHGQTEGHNWQRIADKADLKSLTHIEESPPPQDFPKRKIEWGDLFRSGYHTGITHMHHFYSPRNLRVMSALWANIDSAPTHLQAALRLLVLSYNTAHSTLMTRVVIKNGESDFVLTGAQSGVLYVSSLPVEKNIFEGVRRKIETFKTAFATVFGSKSSVVVHNASSADLQLRDGSVDYIFTDPPFGDYIPYAEINQLSEAWLGKLTNRREEIIMSSAQGKGVTEYGNLMAEVFSEMSRVLKDEGKATVVFHSAKASVWRALMQAYQNAGLTVKISSVLDKVQTSFKQTASTVAVKGDPLLLLTRDASCKQVSQTCSGASEAIIDSLVTNATRLGVGHKERTVERLYSRYVSRCLERGVSAILNAEPFYNRIRSLRDFA
jgi:16S rRNA G966 N2-methylase RsmD